MDVSQIKFETLEELETKADFFTHHLEPGYRTVFPVCTTWDELRKYCISQRIKSREYDDGLFINTLKYIFDKVRVGIYVQIKNTKIHLWTCISNRNFKNDWGAKIDFGEYANVIEFYKAKCAYNKSRTEFINKNPLAWNANGGIIQFFPMKTINDTGISELYDMFKDLCDSCAIPDCEFFINRRDHPLLKRNHTEPYHQLFKTRNIPLNGHTYPEGHLPILSMCTTPEYMDIPIPTYEDWAMATGKYYARTFGNRVSANTNYITKNVEKYNLDWETKKDQAVFRGSATGYGTTIHTNQRLKLASMNNSSDTLDVGITSWAYKCKKITGEPVSFLRYRELPFELANKMSMDQQTNYKYIICVDGNVSAFRLTNLFRTKSVVIMVESSGGYSLWYYEYLKRGIHYIPVKADLSDLHQALEWCQNNPEHCKKITENAYELYYTKLSRPGILNYLKNKLLSL